MRPIPKPNLAKVNAASASALLVISACLYLFAYRPSLGRLRSAREDFGNLSASFSQATRLAITLAEAEAILEKSGAKLRPLEEASSSPTRVENFLRELDRLAARTGVFMFHVEQGNRTTDEPGSHDFIPLHISVRAPFVDLLAFIQQIGSVDSALKTTQLVVSNDGRSAVCQMGISFRLICLPKTLS